MEPSRITASQLSWLSSAQVKIKNKKKGSNTEPNTEQGEGRNLEGRADPMRTSVAEYSELKRQLVLFTEIFKIYPDDCCSEFCQNERMTMLGQNKEQSEMCCWCQHLWWMSHREVPIAGLNTEEALLSIPILTRAWKVTWLKCNFQNPLVTMWRRDSASTDIFFHAVALVLGKDWACSVRSCSAAAGPNHFLSRIVRLQVVIISDPVSDFSSVPHLCEHMALRQCCQRTWRSWLGGLRMPEVVLSGKSLAMTADMAFPP